MKKKVFGRQLSRDTNERKALFKSLMTSLVLHESIETTEAKAKAIRGSVEKLVTKAKKGWQAKHLVQPELSADAVKKLIDKIAPRFADRPGGYTRIIKIGNRFADNAPMAIIEWVEKAKDMGVGSLERKSETKALPAPKVAKNKKQQAIAVEPAEKGETKRTTRTKKAAKKK